MGKLEPMSSVVLEVLEDLLEEIRVVSESIPEMGKVQAEAWEEPGLIMRMGPVQGATLVRELIVIVLTKVESTDLH
jgi:hypothetical protein